MAPKLERLPGGMTLDTAGGFPLSTDSMCLGAFCPVFRGARATDLGSGCGTLGLLLLGREKALSVAGVEIDPTAHQTALANIRRNGLEGNLRSILGDICDICSLFPPGAFDLVVSNPPYFSPGRGRSSPDSPRKTAREGANCSLETVYGAAAWLLPTGGRFCLSARTEDLTELLCLGRALALEPKRLQFIRHRASAQPKVLLLECRKDGGRGLRLEPDLVLYEEDGRPTAQMRKIYEL